MAPSAQEDSSERAAAADPSWEPNEVWSADFVFGRNASGRTLKFLLIVDDAMHEAGTIIVEHCMGGNHLVRVCGAARRDSNRQLRCGFAATQSERHRIK